MAASASPGGELSGQSAPLPLCSLAGPALALGIEQDGDTLSLRLTGDFDLASVSRVERVLERAAPSSRIVFDLRGLTFLDLAALRTILRTQERSLSEPFEVFVVRPRGLVNRLFTLTSAGKRLKLVDEPPGPKRQNPANDELDVQTQATTPEP